MLWIWQVAGSTAEEINHIGVWTVAVSTAVWAFRFWWKHRIEEADKRKLEQKLENGWSHGDETLPGSRNPGRTTAQLMEIIHQDLQAFKTETNQRFDGIHKKLGRLEGTVHAFHGGKE